MQGVSLVEDLRLHRLLPELLPQGKRGVKLRTEALGLERMSIQREEQSRGHVRRRAGHDSAIILKQSP